MRRPIAIVLGAGLLAGCGSASVTESPTEAAPEVLELTAGSDPLAPGTYTRSSFTPSVTFSVPEGSEWFGVQLSEGFFDIQQDVGSPDVMAVQFARPTAVHGPDGAAEPADANEATTLLADNPDIDVLEMSPSSIGGLSGTVVVVENDADGRADIVSVPPGPLGIDPGRRLWAAFFDTDDGLLAVMVGGSADRWDETLAAAEPVLESIRIGP